MRRVGGGTVEMLMTRLRMPDNVPIEHSFVTKAIKSAQTQVEQQNFEIRKNVLKYDEVMNKQRTVIYEERRRVLDGEDLHIQVQNMITDVITAYVTGATATGYAEDWDTDTLWTALRTLYPISVDVEQLKKEGMTKETLLEAILADARAAYARREETLSPEITRELERRVVLSVLDRKWREHLYEMDYLKEGIGLRSLAQRDPLVEYQREGFDMFNSMLDSLKEESVGFLYNLQVQIISQEPGDAGNGAATTAPDQGPDGDGASAASAPPAAVAQPNGAARPNGSALPPPKPVGGKQAPVRQAAGAAAGRPATRTRVRPMQPLPTQQAAAPEPVETSGAPTALRAKGLAEPTAKPMSYSGPSEDGSVASTKPAGDGAVTKAPGRNDPCPCRSGKKYKVCHGRPGA